MKAHKRLMQSLRDSRRPVARMAFQPVALAVSGAAGKTVTLARDPRRRPLFAQEGDLWFRNTHVMRFEGGEWVHHRLPGMCRRGGKWVRR